MLRAQRIALRPEPAREDHGQWTATARVARALAGVVLRDPRRDVARDAAVQRAIAAPCDVGVPSHGRSIAESIGVRSKVVSVRGAM
jgi:hypothetical protein